MSLYLLQQIRKVDIKTALELIMLLSLVVVWVVWPLRGTIAARNIALVSGAIASIAWLCMVRPKFVLADLLPIGFLLCVPAWLLALYIFNPVVPHLQWGDLRGTWLRVVIAMIFAVGLGKLFLSRQVNHNIFVWLMAIWPVIILFLFIKQWVVTDIWLEWTVFLYVFKSKIAGVYFLFWSLLLCLATAHYYLLKQKNFDESSPSTARNIKIILITLFFICLIDLFSLRSLNGFITLFIGLIFLSYLGLKKKRKKSNARQNYIKISLIWVGIIAFAIAVVAYDMNYSGRKLVNLGVDIDFIINHDNTGAWKWDGSYKGVYPPTNSISGDTVNGSTYERLTWLIEGLGFMKSNPFGLGYTGQAFSHYMAQAYSGSVATKTHSGWLDFALGAGFIGLISVWMAMGIIFLRAKNTIKNFPGICQAPLYICWAIGILMLLWFIAELSDREYIEHFFFMLAFFSIASAPSKNL